MGFDIIRGSDHAGHATADKSNAVRTSAQTGRPRRRLLRRALVAGPAAFCLLASTAVLAVPAHAVSVTSAGSTVARATDVEGPARGAIPNSVAVPLDGARTSLSRAVARLSHGRYHKAVDSLDTLATRIGQANRAAKNQIGKPPTDPESDDPPGPPSVLAVVRLEHTVATTLLPEFDAMQRPGVVDALRGTLHAALYRRDNLLDAVLALKPGPMGDYADGLADTLPTYSQEIQKLTDALATFSLTAVSRTALQNSQQRVRATKAKMDAAFGGGE
jgi:hypothetical protein